MLTEAKYKKDRKECWTDGKWCSVPDRQIERKETGNNHKKVNWVRKDIIALYHRKEKGRKSSKRIYDIHVVLGRYSVEQQFNELTDKWRQTVAGYSTIKQITRNKWYLDIIGMGSKAIPLILRDLQNEPDYWFEALNHIVQPQTDPISKEHYGDLQAMTDDWLNWGRENRYI